MYSKRLRSASTGPSTSALADAWLRSGATDGRGWLSSQGVTIAGTSTVRVLRDLYTEAGWLGAAVTQSQLATSKTVSKRAKVTIRARVNWGGWKPGNPAAARVALGPAMDGSGLRTLLEQASITIRSIDQTRLNVLGRTLAQALDEGWSTDQLSRALGTVLDNPAWSDMIARTEIRRATTASSLDSYQANGIQMAEWSIADGNACLICQGNAGQGPTPIADGWDGSTGPPAHPNCGCVLLPVINTDTSSGGYQSATADELMNLAAMPTPATVKQALTVLARIPDDPSMPGQIRSPWPDRPRFPGIPREGRWTKAKIKKVHIEDLTASTGHLSRANLISHIRLYGRPDHPEVVYPQVVKADNGDHVIYEGHHRLATLWLLGVPDAAVWQVKERNLAAVTQPTAATK